MSLPASIKEYLKNHIQFCYSEKLDETAEDVKWFQENLGIKKSDSAFITFFSAVAFPPCGNGAELLPLENILENAAIDQEDEELPESIGKKFLRLTSFEGEGAYYINSETDQVYDVPWGAEVDLVKNQHPELASNFGEFLEKYYAQT